MGSNLSQQTAERLYNQIVAEGRLSPGDKLPNEVDLSHELGVSRATLREAIRALTVQGVLEVQRGRGTFVSRQVAEIEDFGFGRLEEIRGRLRDLFELRAIFEPQAARLACVRATEQELAEILTQGERVAARIQAGEDRTQADLEFHGAIVRATHNAFMMRLLPIISQAVETAIGSAGEGQENLAQATLRDHALLLEFFARRDGVGAEHAMAIHMAHAMDEMGLEAGQHSGPGCHS
ncbi:FadR/GntR family transcriptional regulator [Muriventricola aceti]|uniref:FadR/GntR family transcriptional regulator n=1 Tax=Muriventricola aceti TaxID=2981773 RepID=UPI001D88A769|nr:FadR family transcriptional regulator [Clostridiales bacterium]